MAQIAKSLVVAPLIEELFFRGVVQSRLRAHGGFWGRPWVAIVVTAACFGVAHLATTSIAHAAMVFAPANLLEHKAKLGLSPQQVTRLEALRDSSKATHDRAAATARIAGSGSQPACCSWARHSSGITAERSRPSGYFLICSCAHWRFSDVKLKSAGWFGSRRRTDIRRSRLVRAFVISHAEDIRQR
jgi:hypothetical protein